MSVQLLDHGVYGLFECLVVVQFDIEVGTQLQLTCQVAHHRLEERVDGLHAESAIVVYHEVQRLARLGAYLFLRQMQLFHQLVQIRLGVRIARVYAM